jgi:hypothetical protein
MRSYTLTFNEYAITVQQFISMLPTLPINLAESIYHKISRDYLNLNGDITAELHAAGLLRAAADHVCQRGGHAPLFNSFE